MNKTDSINLDAMRHTAAHVLAAASTNLRPDTKLGVGPATDNGFYHDIDVAQHYGESDLTTLEEEMKKIVAQDLPISQREVSKDEANKLFAHDPYKLELIKELPGETVGVSDMGNGAFVTLCKGGHVASTGQIGAFKLTRLAGVYWRGDVTKPQLQRIYGVLFATQAELDDYFTQLEEAKKRDHRKLGKLLDLFTFSPLVGAGLPLFTPRGALIRRELETWLQSIQEPLGYERVVIPHIAKPQLYKTSGHWDKFQNDLFHVTGKHEEEFVMKPMNCPHHTQLFASRPRSYKDMPQRYSEITMVYRDEKAGELSGLSRVRAITQDDAHVFCRPDQIEAEVKKVLDIIQAFYAVFDFELTATLSLRDTNRKEDYLGSDDIWEKAEATLRSLLKQDFADTQERTGEAAFYGPKIDFIAKDSLSRIWQLATVQLDFTMPERFGLVYKDETGQNATPVMIHRAILGSLERFMAILLEHYAGALPLWLSPIHARLLPMGEEQFAFAHDVMAQLATAGLRLETDERSVSIGKKIHEAQAMKIPVMLVIGKKEVEKNEVTVRLYGKTEQKSISVDTLKESLLQAISNKTYSI